MKLTTIYTYIYYNIKVHDQRPLMEPPNNFAHIIPSGCGNVFKNNICSNIEANGICVNLSAATNCSTLLNTDTSNTIINY